VDLDGRELIVRKGCGSGWKGVNRKEGCVNLDENS